MKKVLNIFIFLSIIATSNQALSNDENFQDWLGSFKTYALKKNISEKTYNIVMSNVQFNPKVIEYDRYQPEFYEDTNTYIKKRTSSKKVEKAINVYKKNKKFIDKIEKEFLVEKELLLALMGIETNYGLYLGKMDILSSLATLSFDKRRRDFFTNELITVLQLIDKKIIDHNILYGSWAGAFGNFQFMPSTIKNYAIDYDQNSKIELREIKDSFASAANYINKIGWKKNDFCFDEIVLSKDIPKKFLNTSARKIKNKTSFSKIKQYLLNGDDIDINNKKIIGIITPDRDIIPNSKILTPAYITSDNYELILKWNRSLRFALAVCTLKEKITNEL